MIALVTLMLLAATASLLLLGAGRRRLATLPLLGELVMLLAMLDTHLPALGLAPPLLWSALLALCALGTALVERMRRRVAGARHADRLHTVGMLIAAGFIAAGAASSIATGPGAHAHGGLGLQAPLLAALAVYAVAATAGIRGRATPRRERLRRAASAVALLAMGGMALA